jgi:hypothetical protein
MASARLGKVASILAQVLNRGKGYQPASRIVLACFEIPRELWRRSGAGRATEAASRHPSSAAATRVVSQKQLNHYKNNWR